jgi:hypothetical protein
MAKKTNTRPVRRGEQTEIPGTEPERIEAIVDAAAVVDDAEASLKAARDHRAEAVTKLHKLMADRGLRVYRFMDRNGFPRSIRVKWGDPKIEIKKENREPDGPT